MQFHKTIKEIENRLGDKDLRLESAIVTPTNFSSVRDRGLTKQDWANSHVYFMLELSATGNPDFIDNLMRLVTQ